MQFQCNGRVRVSFCQKDVRDRYLSEGIHFGDQDIPVTRDGQNVTVVYIRDLPYEVPSDDVVDFFSSYGEVLTAERSVAAKFPGLCNGNRILKMILNQDLPYFLSVCVAVSVVCGTVGNRSNVLYVAKLAIGLSPPHSLAGAGTFRTLVRLA